MEIDWNVAATIAAPIIALVGGAVLNHFFENRPRLITYLGHASVFRSSQDSMQPITVNTHSLVLRNAGRKTATNVRLGHIYLPEFQIYPDIEYTVIDLPGGGKEIQIPALVPKKQLTISYLYFPPVTWNQINTHIESDDGPAKVINILPVRQYPNWVYAIFWFFMIYGAIALVYTAVSLPL